MAAESPRRDPPVAMAEALGGFAAHLRDERGRSPHTVRAYLGDVEQLIAFSAGQGCASPADLDLAILRSWLASLNAAGQSRATIARRAASARAFTPRSREAREAFGADSWGNFDTSLIRDAEVESVSEDPTIWRAREHCNESNVDVHSAASADSGALSVFSALTESHATAVDSDAIDAEYEQMSVASREIVEDES